ncbi:MAG: ABC transporter permease [Planctomycetota bacterium]|nr:ABC transporter permease [Planctomycetota bacterium]
MRIASTLSLALRRLRRRPIRSLLLLQGTVWGVAVAIFPAAVIQGTRITTVTQAEELGADRIAAVADPTSASEVKLAPADVDHLRAYLEGVGHTVTSAAAVQVDGPLPTAEGVTVLRSTPEGPLARGLELEAGRWFGTDENDACVVEAQVGTVLGRSLALGDTLAVAGTERRVVGIMKPRSQAQLRTNDLGFDLEHAMYKGVAQQFLMAMGIPYVKDDAWKRTDACVYVPVDADATVDWLYVRVDPSQLSAAGKSVREGLVSRGKTVLTLYPIVLPVILGDEVNRFDAVTIAMFLACLVMGAVVMANLGLLNALSRSREIAIRRVEGATRSDIALHFLMEGIVLSLIGCGLGCLLGMGLAELRVQVEPVTGFTWTFPTTHALIACGVAVVIGVLAALFPALRASSQDPVRGLAHD